jgi:hypothetical protein
MNQLRLERAIVVIALIGGIIALFGTYWDDAWHTDLGRDEFASPPHLVLYGGVALVGLAVAIWAGQTALTRRTFRALLTEPALLLAGIGVLATFLSAPIDDFWHTAFGRDSVLWSPPHMAGVAALFAVCVALLLKSKQLFGATSFLTVTASALLLGAALIPVMEYETDVPQFSMMWYLPVQTLGSVLAFTIIKTVTQTKWGVVKASIVYTLLRGLIFVILFASAHSTPIIPPILASAIIFDALMQLRWSSLLRAFVYSTVTFIIYALYLIAFYNGFEQTIPTLLLGIAISIGIVGVVLTLDHQLYVKHLSLIAAPLILIGSLLPVQTALAHDPGQGEDVASIQLSARSTNTEVEIVAEIENQNCDGLTPIAVVARRAGETLRAGLRPNESCTFEGMINVTTEGRWFIYTEFQTENDIIEAWLPVVIGDQEGTFQKITTLYKPPQVSASSPQLIAGIVLYAANISLIGYALYLARKQMLVMAQPS